MRPRHPIRFEQSRLRTELTLRGHGALHYPEPAYGLAIRLLGHYLHDGAKLWFLHRVACEERLPSRGPVNLTRSCVSEAVKVKAQEVRIARPRPLLPLGLHERLRLSSGQGGYRRPALSHAPRAGCPPPPPSFCSTRRRGCSSFQPHGLSDSSGQGRRARLGVTGPRARWSAHIWTVT